MSEATKKRPLHSISGDSEDQPSKKPRIQTTKPHKVRRKVPSKTKKGKRKSYTQRRLFSSTVTLQASEPDTQRSGDAPVPHTAGDGHILALPIKATKSRKKKQVGFMIILSHFYIQSRIVYIKT